MLERISSTTKITCIGAAVVALLACDGPRVFDVHEVTPPVAFTVSQQDTSLAGIPSHTCPPVWTCSACLGTPADTLGNAGRARDQVRQVFTPEFIELLRWLDR